MLNIFKYNYNIHYCITGKKGRTLRAEQINQRLGMALAIALFSSSERANFLQKCIGIELWKQGCSQKVIKTMNHMGVSMGVKATRVAIDKMRLGHQDKIKDWKAKAEVQIKISNIRN